MHNIKANTHQIGLGSQIASSAIIECDELILGRDCLIGERVQIVCKGKVILEDQCLIGNDTVIRLHSFSMGEYTKLHNHALVNGKASVYIGHNCWIGQNCCINGEADLHIGNNVGIGTYSSIWTHGYFGQLVDGCQFNSVKSTHLEDDAWLIGSYNTVFPGITIGKQAVLMGTSVVTKNLEPGHVYSGNPAKDITDKVGLPYKPIAYPEKIKLIKSSIISYLNENNISFTLEAEKLSLEERGTIYFDSENEVKTADAVIFHENYMQWDDFGKSSHFCLTTKQYSKQYSALEILVKRILGSVVARFIPYINAQK